MALSQLRKPESTTRWTVLFEEDGANRLEEGVVAKDDLGPPFHP